MHASQLSFVPRARLFAYSIVVCGSKNILSMKNRGSFS